MIGCIGWPIPVAADIGRALALGSSRRPARRLLSPNKKWVIPLFLGRTCNKYESERSAPPAERAPMPAYAACENRRHGSRLCYSILDSVLQIRPRIYKGYENSLIAEDIIEIQWSGGQSVSRQKGC
jgi:hypothetical protein